MSGSPPSSNLARFVAELRRRHVVRVSIGYAAAGFVLLQAAEIVLPAFLPGFEADAALRVVVVAFLLLFPVVVALAWVYEITPQGIVAMEVMDAEAGRPASGRLMPRLALLALTVVVAGGAGLWWYQTDAEAQAARETAFERRLGEGPAGAGSTPFQAATTDDAGAPIRSLAVLPLDDYGDATVADDAWFAAGMHEAIISQLSQLGTVRVISRTSSEGYDREGRSMPQVGADLGVDAVVEGSVLRAEGRVRITVQLIHAASDTHLWAQDYDRDLEDVLTLQREVATAIAEEIEARLEDRSSPATTATEAVAVSAPAAPVAPELQDAVMRGRFALRDAEDGAAYADDAEQFFADALALDASFSPALTGLAGVHLLRGLEEDAGPEALRELLDAREIAVRAVEVDSTSVEAREVLASAEEALAEHGMRLARFAVELGRQMEPMGSDSVRLVVRGDTTIFRRGDAPVASATEMGRMIQLAMAREESESADDDLRAIVRLEVGGRFDQALERARSALDEFPDDPRIWDAAERLRVTNGDVAGAVALRRERAERPGLGVASGPGVDDLERRVSADGARGYWGWRLEHLEARADAGERVSPVERAAAHSALGEADAALTLLEQALDRRDPHLVSLRTDPVWDPLRPDDRFKSILRSLGPRNDPRSRPPQGGIR